MNILIVLPKESRPWTGFKKFQKLGEKAFLTSKEDYERMLMTVRPDIVFVYESLAVTVTQEPANEHIGHRHPHRHFTEIEIMERVARCMDIQAEFSIIAPAGSRLRRLAARSAGIPYRLVPQAVTHDEARKFIAHWSAENK